MLPAFLCAAMLILTAPAVAAEKEKTPFLQVDALLTLLDIPHKKNRASMIQATQVWRRKQGVERWEVPASRLEPAKRQAVMALLHDLGMVGQRLPQQKEYDHVLVLGGTVPAMERRFQNAVMLSKQGIHFKKIYFLTGQRPLVSEIDRVDSFVRHVIGSDNPAARPATESEAARMIWFSTPLPSAPAAFVDSARKWQNKQWVRPCTQDTVEDWLATSPATGSVLVISDQPHIKYQAAVVKRALPSGFSVDASAPAANPQININTYLDALALWLANDDQALLPASVKEG
ncbi:hypothetical protein [Candidatus Sororendozoicomonas aggregata]|uniref:hypothetical protein n=1 Tax=Candidatus Sororendozoicomonas aggregata TaxID=3073239 RepID=UPI002ED631AF